MDPITLTSKGNAPVIRETEEQVTQQGVRLFMHNYAGKLANAPMLSSRFTLDPGSGTEEDQHAVSEIWFISQGDLDVFYDGIWHRVKNGESLYFSPFKPHFARNNGAGQVQVFSVWWA